MATKATDQKSQMKRGTFILEGAAAQAFNQAQEVYTGLNILKLKVGETAGVFTLVKILKNQVLGGLSAKRKTKPVDVYVATFEGREIRMPIAASFTGKARDSKLAEGDKFMVRRADDYTSKEFGTRNCASYEIAITERAKK